MPVGSNGRKITVMRAWSKDSALGLEPAMPSGGGGGAAAGGGGSGLGGRITWAPFGQDAWIGVPLPPAPWPALSGGDVPLNPFAQAVFARVGQQTAFLTHGSFYAEWDLSAAGIASVPALPEIYAGVSGAWLAAEAAWPGITANAGDFLAGLVPYASPSLTWGGVAAAGYGLYANLRCFVDRDACR